MTNNWTEIQDGFEKIVETENAKVTIDYFPLEGYANIRVFPPNDEEGEVVAEKIRLKARSTGLVKEETTVYDLYGSFWDTDDDGVLSEGEDWEITEIELKTDIESDENPSENDKNVFEALEQIAKYVNYGDELEAAKQEGFCIPKNYEEEE